MTGPRDTVGRRMRALTSARVLKAITATLYEGADAVRAEAHVSISRGSASGQVAGSKHKHVASRPGEPPHREFGDLQAGLSVDMPEPYVAQVTSNAGHSKSLEFGTSKMAARPFMRPARDKLKDKVRSNLATNINRILKGR